MEHPLAKQQQFLLLPLQRTLPLQRLHLLATVRQTTAIPSHRNFSITSQVLQHPVRPPNFTIYPPPISDCEGAAPTVVTSYLSTFLNGTLSYLSFASCLSLSKHRHFNWSDISFNRVIPHHLIFTILIHNGVPMQRVIIHPFASPVDEGFSLSLQRDDREVRLLSIC